MEKTLDHDPARTDAQAEAAFRDILAAADVADTVRMDALLDPAAKHYMNGLEFTNDDLKQRATSFRVAFPDIKRDLLPVASANGTATVRGRISGTNRSEFAGKPANGKHFSISALGFCKINEAGKITEITVQMNYWAMMEQLYGTPTV